MDKAGNSLLWRKLHDPVSILTPRQEKPWPPAQSQFPSKYGQLPGIGDSPHPSPRPNQDNQIVPVRSGGKGNTVGMGQRSNTDQSDTEERIRQLEMRLGVSEKSNRALLEEVLRLQNDLRIATKRSEEVIRDERDARQQLSEAIRISNELISQLSERIKETEEKIQDEKASLSSLFSHTKNVEKTVLTSQQDIQSRRDAQSMRLQELRAELNETKQARSQLEQVTYALSDELRSLRNKVEGQQAEFVNMVSDVRNRARKLEDESRIHLETMRKQSDMHSLSDVTTTQLRGQVETRLSELRDVLMDVRGKQETEQNERRNLEKAMQAKMNELYTSLSEQTRKREEGLHTVDMVLREKDHAAQAERLQMTSKVTDTVEDINKRLLAKEMKIREEIQQKFLQLEKLVQREQHSRQEFEKSSREDGDRKWQTLKKVLEEELNILKEKLEVERGRSRDTIAKLDQSITIVEKQLAENKRQVDKVMTAEIKSRKIHEAGTSEKIGSVNEKLQVATSTLQQAIVGVSQSLASNNEKIRRELKTMMTEQQQAGTRALSDMDVRMNGIKQRMTTLEDQLDARVASVYNDSWKEFANMELGEMDFETKDEEWDRDSGHEDDMAMKEMDVKNMSESDMDLFNVLCFIFSDVNSKAAESLSSRVNERVEAITKWQDATGDTLRELGRSVQTIPQDIYQLEEKYKLLKSEMDSRVSHESDSRIKEIQVLKKEVGMFKNLLDTLPKPVTLTREIETLRQEITMLKSRLDRQPKPATLQDLEAMNVNVRKLADNLQTVKTVLGMKIQSEQKLRGDEVQHLQGQLDDIKKAIEPMIGRSNSQFVKDEPGGQQDEPDVNKWGVYNAYKWLMWKSHLTYKLWEIRARKHKGNLPAPNISHPQPNSISSTVNYGKQKLAGPGHVSSSSKSDQVVSPVYENQKTIKTQSFPKPSQTFSPSPIQTKHKPLSPNSSLLRPSSSYSPTPRVVEAHKPEQTDTDPGETYSPVLGRDDQHNLDKRGHKSDELLLSDRLSDSEIGNEEIISPRSPVQEYNTNLQPVSKTKLTPIESRESSENDFLHGHTLENNVVEINGENMLKVN